MVLKRLDGVALVKASAVTCGFYAVMHHVVAPLLDATGGRQTWMKWATTGTGILTIGCAVALAAFAIWSICYRQLVYRLVFFRGIPKTKTHHTGCIIWLHGSGDSGAGFTFLRSRFSQSHPHIKWVLPEAPKIPLTAASPDPLFPVHLRAWFDMKAMPVTAAEPDDKDNLARAVKRVHELVEMQVADGIPPAAICLGGFSQGGSVAVWASAQSKRKLGGVVVWSGYAPCAAELQAALLVSANRRLPHHVAHGNADTKVLLECGEELVSLLKKAGTPVTLAKYDMEHECHPLQIDALDKYLTQQIPARYDHEKKKKA